jgi:NAD(P)H-dependent FMN reductase
MQLLAFAASTSTQSLNKQLVAYATRLIEDGLVPDLVDVTVETIDLVDYEMPIYSIDRQQEAGIPPAAVDFYDRIGRSDALLISFAEHNGHYTAAYKNLFDWASRISRQVYQGKPTVMLSTSPGARGGRSVLETAVRSAPSFGNEVRASLAIPSFHDNFDAATATLTDPELDTELRSALATLAGDPERSLA